MFLLFSVRCFSHSIFFEPSLAALHNSPDIRKVSSDDNSGNHNSNEHQRNIAPVAVNHKGSRDYRADNRAYGNHFCYCNKNNRTTDSNEQLNRGQHKQTAKRDRNAFPSAELIKTGSKCPSIAPNSPMQPSIPLRFSGMT